MSDIARHVRSFGTLDGSGMESAMRIINDQLDRINSRLGGIGNDFIDDPAQAIPASDPPAQAWFNVIGLDGQFHVYITLPQNINPTSVAVMGLQNTQSDMNSAGDAIYHQIQSCLSIDFDLAHGLVDYGVTSQVTLTVQDPNATRFWRIRSSYDQVNWNDWQIFSSSILCGPVGVWSQLLRNSANSLVSSAVSYTGTNPLTQFGTSTQINVAASFWTAGDQTISYNPGSVDPGSYGTWLLYAIDNTRVGGTVTFIATQASSDITANDGSIYFGKITTAGGGGGTGGGGGGGTCCRAGVPVRGNDSQPKDISTVRVNDILMGIDGGPEVVQKVDVIPARPCFHVEFDAAGKLIKKDYLGDFTVYRLHLDRSHTYIAGANGVIDGACSEHIIQYSGGGFCQVFEAVVGEPFNLINGGCGSHNVSKQ